MRFRVSIFMIIKWCTLAECLTPSARGEIEIMDLNNIYLQQGQLLVKSFGRGLAWLDAGTHESLLQAATFIEAIQQRQGLMIACPEEIAYRMDFISEEQLYELGKSLSHNEYGDYILGLIPDYY